METLAKHTTNQAFLSLVAVGSIFTVAAFGINNGKINHTQRMFWETYTDKDTATIAYNRLWGRLHKEAKA